MEGAIQLVRGNVADDALHCGFGLRSQVMSDRTPLLSKPTGKFLGLDPCNISKQFQL